MVYRWEEADLPLLQGEGGPQAHLLQPLGEAAHLVWELLGLHPLPCGVAAHDNYGRAVCKSHAGTRVMRGAFTHAQLTLIILHCSVFDLAPYLSSFCIEKSCKFVGSTELYIKVCLCLF